jgi:anti-sigma regulatory factor (Ser/Thr protein kinase)
VLTLPLPLILLHTNGLLGYYIGQLSAEAGAVLITYLFVIIYSKVKKLNNQGLLLIPNFREIDKYDVTVDNDKANVSILSQEVETYALKHGVSFRDASMIALGAEEMVANIIEYGYKIKNHHYYIDVTLKIVDDKMILMIKDDGIVFDPTEYKEDEKEFSTSGILLVRKIVDKISYTRVLNTNNTSIEIYLSKGAA